MSQSEAGIKALCIVPLLFLVDDSTLHGSLRSLFTRSPAEPTLDGSDEMYAIKTSVSNEVEWLDRADANTACAVKPIPIAHHGMYNRLNTLAHVPWGMPYGACLSVTLEGNKHF